MRKYSLDAQVRRIPGAGRRVRQRPQRRAALLYVVASVLALGLLPGDLLPRAVHDPPARRETRPSRRRRAGSSTDKCSGTDK
ncbi:hypothetical protein [Streptomyces sp. RB17]|uniref:hypothetical protein n=1 Tax=Streptomyces sp. RB17 TaxID=2585197 RepID=UPI001294F589|nr:hypothetical protein [Streptomyces sp. RB17]